jgi:hypothetical protein
MWLEYGAEQAEPMLARFADDNELIAHDCGLHGNPSHTGVDDLEREYSAELQARMMLYHYASVSDGDALRARGHRVAIPGECVPLAPPTAMQAP